MEEFHILAIGAHPDDIELSCMGTLIHHIKLGYNVSILDLSAGELGSRGSAELRLIEAHNAANLVGVKKRLNAGLPDGFIQNDRDSLMKVIPYLRYFKPDWVFANALEDRHPDHGKAATLIKEACFLSGLIKIETFWEGEAQKPWRPRSILHYAQDFLVKPDVIFDITPYMEEKVAAILCSKSQFYQPGSTEPETPISTKHYMENVRCRTSAYGRYINVQYAEAYQVSRPIGIRELQHLY